MHENIHTNKGKKSYECGICSKVLLLLYIYESIQFKIDFSDFEQRFTLEHYLKNHAKIHAAGERQFSCQICKKVIRSIYFGVLKKKLSLIFFFYIKVICQG